ncbi:hypothetical protein SAMN05421790_102337 [Kroppenstedtia eburnea]|uniref:Uncharacterized protein n=1 Tax=Kroppenstedtia eburnea TaxID=714067 RepID=A0A1N7JX77_9BACL|nr:hypothetical protein SAMN05421790_102337 [Kroppenstedtia eburnea]
MFLSDGRIFAYPVQLDQVAVWSRVAVAGGGKQVSIGTGAGGYVKPLRM